MGSPDIVFGSITDIAPHIASGDISPCDLTEAALQRIEDQNRLLNAYITVTADRAREDALQATAEIEASRYRGPLHGIPVAIKDLFATRGVPTTYGSPLFADWIPEHDAAVVARLQAAGAIVVGKTNLHELAYGTTSNNAFYGPVRNPWDVACDPGGSSGGSAAAVATGLAFAALGSDTGASIRQPAHCCGVVGLKPTFGRVSKRGTLPLSWSMDHAGPMTRTVRDGAVILQVLAGYDDHDPCSVDRPVPDYLAPLDGDIRGVRIGVVRDYFLEHCDPEVAASVEAAVEVLADLGANVGSIALPDMEAAFAAGTVILGSEAAACHSANLRERPDAFSDELRGTLGLAGFYSAVQYVQAQRMRRQLSVETVSAMAEFGAFVTPTSPVPATPIDDTPPAHGPLRHRCTIPFNLIGLPAVSVPCGFTTKRLPIGLQIVGKSFDEVTVLRVAHAYEQATYWHRRHPDR